MPRDRVTAIAGKPCSYRYSVALKNDVNPVGARLAREEARKANKSAPPEPVAIHWCAKV
jgi:hypothetical protein